MKQLSIEQNSSVLAQNLTILIILFLITIVIIIYVKIEHDKKFGIWFNKILEKAPLYNFSEVEINDFQEIFWWDYFNMDLTPEEAIIQYKKDNNK